MEYKAHLEKKMLESSAVTATILDAHNRYLMSTLCGSTSLDAEDTWGRESNPEI